MIQFRVHETGDVCFVSSESMLQIQIFNYWCFDIIDDHSLFDSRVFGFERCGFAWQHLDMSALLCYIFLCVCAGLVFI